MVLRDYLESGFQISHSLSLCPLFCFVPIILDSVPTVSERPALVVEASPWTRDLGAELCPGAWEGHVAAVWASPIGESPGRVLCKERMCSNAPAIW